MKTEFVCDNCKKFNQSFMQLNGQKNNVNVTLQIKETDFVLVIDSAHKVVKFQYTDQTKLSEIRAKIDSLVNELGYTPKKVIHTRVNKFNFNK